jgi:hypothetical protein
VSFAAAALARVGAFFVGLLALSVPALYLIHLLVGGLCR